MTEPQHYPYIINIQRCSMSDARNIYDCRYDPDSHRNSFSVTIPSYNDHKAWFKKALDNTAYCYLKGISDCGHFVGFVRFYTKPEGLIEVSVCVHPQYRGMRIGSRILREAIALRGDVEKMYAEIKLTNTKSFLAFAAISSPAPSPQWIDDATIRNEILDSLERDFKGRKVEDVVAETRRFPGSLRTEASK